jgi:hypothetical protein
MAVGAKKDELGGRSVSPGCASGRPAHRPVGARPTPEYLPEKDSS